MAEWFEDEYLATTVNENVAHSVHCEVTSSGMENEPVGKLDSPWPYLTIHEVYSVDEANKTTNDRIKNPPAPLVASPLNGSRFDIRTYREIKRWQAEDWEGEGGGGKNASADPAPPGLMSLDIEHVASVAAMEWSIEAYKKEEIMKFYTDVVGPTISSSPDVLRFRVFEIDSATTIEGEKSEVKEKENLHQLFTLVELESEEWPWDVVIDLAEEQAWKDYFEKQHCVVRMVTLADTTFTNQSAEMAAESLLGEKSIPQRKQGARCLKIGYGGEHISVRTALHIWVISVPTARDAATDQQCQPEIQPTLAYCIRILS